jgi:nucleotide-binding universal stress UspA family protein
MKTILVPTDFSKDADNAAKYALQLAKVMQAELILFNAYELFIAMDPMQPISVPYYELERASREMLNKTKTRLNEIEPSIRIHCVNAMDYPAGAICNYAETLKPELIVMGMKGRGAFANFFLGSTAATVIRKSSIPVLLIPAAQKFNPSSKIVFAYDFGKVNKAVAGFIKEFISIFHAELNILTVVDELEKGEPSLKMAEKRLSHAFRGMDYTAYVRESMQLESKIMDFLAKSKTDILIVEHRDHNFIHRLLKESVARMLAFDLKIPMLSIPETIKRRRNVIGKAVAGAAALDSVQ